ncbi:CPS_collapsed_G0003690.mRNA.1.CDS.1 [Saccharomyces cerevisiae]|nr:CPS_collapsed_G0003690.mRNA.1.CDS.1 [Saccharomyces cerevisiae]
MKLRSPLNLNVTISSVVYASKNMWNLSWKTTINLLVPVCHIGLSIDLSQPALEVDLDSFKKAKYC